MNHGLTGADYKALVHAAHKGRVPPYPMRVFICLLSSASYRLTCHPGIRYMADHCSMNKETVGNAVNWLERNGIIVTHRKLRTATTYVIQKSKHWHLSRHTGQFDNVNLSGSTTQMAVPPHRTVKNAKLQAICPATPDVSKDSAQGAIGNASHLEEIGNEPSATVNGHKLAFG